MDLSRLGTCFAPLIFLGQLTAPLQAAPTLQSTAAQSPSENSDFDVYILGVGDRLELSFPSPSYNPLGGSFELLNDGSTSLPLIGSVVLNGLTVNQANRWLTSLYTRYLRRPDVNLRVSQPRPMQVSVLGEVEKPGIYVISPGGEGSTVEGKATTVPGMPTVVSAIQKAGGITLNSNLADVRLQRQLPGDSTKLRETELNLVRLLQKGDKRQNPFLFDGDTIVVGKASAPPPDEVLKLAAVNLFPGNITVNVVGEVKTPGRIPMRAGTPLMQALFLAGGPLPIRAKRNNVELVRMHRDGTTTLSSFSIDYKLGVSGTRNPPLVDGDTVIVNRSVLASTTDTLNTVSLPLTGVVNLVSLWSILYNTNNNNN
jgi:polysaccharide export outer membrane protein